MTPEPAVDVGRARRRRWPLVLAALALGLLIAGVAAWAIFKGRTYQLFIEREQIQAAIDAKLPYDKDFLLVLSLRVKGLTVRLDEGSDRIGADADLGLNLQIGTAREPLGATARIDTRLRYDQQRFCLYLIEPEVHRASLRGIPDRYTDVALRYARLGIQHLVNEVPVYTIRDDSLKLKLARAVVKDVAVHNGRVVVTLGY